MARRASDGIIFKQGTEPCDGAEHHRNFGYPSAMEIGFYHLTQSTLDKALPKLLAKVLSLNGRALVLSGSAELLAEIDGALWQADEWLPHNAHTDDLNASLQPIWLTTADDPAPNEARHLFLIGGAQTTHLTSFDRGFDLFDGLDEASVQAARVRFRQAREAGHALTYWQQGETGRWEKRV